MGELEFAITTILPLGVEVPSSYYGRCIDAKRETGLLVARLNNVVIVVVYKSPYFTPQVVTQTEALADFFRKNGL